MRFIRTVVLAALVVAAVSVGSWWIALILEEPVPAGCVGAPTDPALANPGDTANEYNGVVYYCTPY